MTLFDEREHAFEAMFVHDEEMRFRALARRDKLLAAWAAGRLGLSPQDADAYQHELLRDIVMPNHEAHLAEKLKADFERTGAPVPDAEIRSALTTYLQQAIRELRAEP